MKPKIYGDGTHPEDYPRDVAVWGRRCCPSSTCQQHSHPKDFGPVKSRQDQRQRHPTATAPCSNSSSTHFDGVSSANFPEFPPLCTFSPFHDFFCQRSGHPPLAPPPHVRARARPPSTGKSLSSSGSWLGFSRPATCGRSSIPSTSR